MSIFDLQLIFSYIIIIIDLNARTLSDECNNDPVELRYSWNWIGFITD